MHPEIEKVFPLLKNQLVKQKNLLILLKIDSIKGTLVIKIAKINCSTIPERTNLQFIFLLSEDNK